MRGGNKTAHGMRHNEAAKANGARQCDRNRCQNRSAKNHDQLHPSDIQSEIKGFLFPERQQIKFTGRPAQKKQYDTGHADHGDEQFFIKGLQIPQKPP